MVVLEANKKPEPKPAEPVVETDVTDQELQVIFECLELGQFINISAISNL